MNNLKELTIRGGYARAAAVAANFALRLGSVIILARLLDPKDFGLLGMVTAFTGVLSLFRDFGLSAAAVQLASVSSAQSSTLFWINLLVGALLTLIAAVCAPAVSGFYHEPRLLLVTVVVAAGFLFNGAGVQHSALLQRQMRFRALAVIDVIALILSIAAAISLALAGFGYWALVAMTLSTPVVTTIGLWVASGWVPQMPSRRIGLRSMMKFGGALTLNGFVVYIASNFDKVLVGRYWGADALGIYGRAYQLVRIPTDTLNSAVGEVAFSALSRLHNDAQRLKSYFLKGYSLVLALTVPVTVVCGLFADDMVRVLLGPKWTQAIPIFRLLAPTILVFAIANPLGWLLTALGLVGRGLRISFVIGPLMILGYVIGLSHGPRGVALAYSTVMIFWAVPAILWCIHGTVFSFLDIIRVIARPVASIVPAAIVGAAFHFFVVGRLGAWPRLTLECAILLLAYLTILLFAGGPDSFYLKLLRSLRTPTPKQEEFAPVR